MITSRLSTLHIERVANDRVIAFSIPGPAGIIVESNVTVEQCLHKFGLQSQSAFAAYSVIRCSSTRSPFRVVAQVSTPIRLVLLVKRFYASCAALFDHECHQTRWRDSSTWVSAPTSSLVYIRCSLPTPSKSIWSSRFQP